MAQKRGKMHVDHNGHSATAFPPEAFDYNDDVSADVLKDIRKRVGVDVSDGKWSTVDGFGEVVNA